MDKLKNSQKAQLSSASLHSQVNFSTEDVVSANAISNRKNRVTNLQSPSTNQVILDSSVGQTNNISTRPPESKSATQVKTNSTSNSETGNSLDKAKSLVANYIEENDELAYLSDALEKANIITFDSVAETGRNILARVGNLGQEDQIIQFDENFIEQGSPESIAAVLLHEITHSALHDHETGELKEFTSSIEEEIEAYNLQFEFWGEVGYKENPTNKYDQLQNKQYEDFYLTGKVEEFVENVYGASFPAEPEPVGASKPTQEDKFKKQYQSDFQNIWDLNKDGSLSAKEMVDDTGWWDKDAWAEHTARHDTNGDKMLNLDELISVFKEFDSDTNGKLNPREMKNYTNADYGNEAIPDADYDRYLETKFELGVKSDFQNVWDLNKDGSLSFKEMVTDTGWWDKDAWTEHTARNDVNGDNMINLDELMAISKKFDSDRNGTVEGAEFEKYTNADYGNEAIPDADYDKYLETKFELGVKSDFQNVWDLNKDGSLSFKEMVTDTGWWDKDAWTEHTARNDVNGDNMINLDELMAISKKFDSDRNGTVEGAEFEKYVNADYGEINESLFPSTQNVEEILNEYANSAGTNYPISVALISGNQVKYYSVGDKDLDKKNGVQTPTEDSQFSIGSVSKIFTATLLADMVQRGELSLDDPVQQYLPEGVELPKYEGKEITLEHLASHTSGLRDPITNPADSKDIDDLFSFAESTTLASEPGKEYKYSNYGYGLLEEALGFAYAQKSGEEYIPEITFENLLSERILNPLDLDTTKISLSAEENANLTKGFNRGSIAGKTDTFVGSGGIHSTTEDLAKFLQANIQAHDKAAQGLELSPVESALLLAQEVQHSSIQGGELGSSEIGLGWYLNNGDTLKLGSVPGTTTYINFSNENNTGMVITGGSSNFRPAEIAEKLNSLMSTNN